MPLDFTQPYQRIVGDLRDTPGAYYVQGGIAYTLDGTPIGSRGTYPPLVAPGQTPIPGKALVGVMSCDVMSCIGTSLMQHAQSWSATTIANAARGIMTWVQVLMGQRCQFLNWTNATTGLLSQRTASSDGKYFAGCNHGISGQFTEQIRGRVQNLVKIGSHICIVDGGTNDCAGIAPELIKRNLRETAEALLQANIICIHMGILTRGTSVSSYGSGASARKVARYIDRWKRAYCAQTPGTIFVDANKFWVDPNDPDGQPLSGHSDDGIHTTPKGAYQVARAFAEVLNPLIPIGPPPISSADDLFDSTYNPAGSLFSNPLLQGTAGTLGTGASGSVASSWRVECLDDTVGVTAVASKVARTDGPGIWQQIVVTTTGGGTTTSRVSFRTSTANLALPAGVISGMWLQAECDIDMGAQTGDAVNYASLILEDFNGVSARDLGEYSGFRFPTAAWAGRLRTPPFQVANIANIYRFRFEMNVASNVATTFTVRIACIVARVVDSPEIILNGG